MSTHPKCNDCGEPHQVQRQRCRRYNGWTNYETWNVALWLDNEQGTQERWSERAQEILQDPGEPLYASQTPEERATSILAYELETAIGNDEQPELDASLYSDLLGAALSEVDWHEIASHYIEAARERMPA